LESDFLDFTFDSECDCDLEGDGCAVDDDEICEYDCGLVTLDGDAFAFWPLTVDLEIGCAAIF